MAAFVTDELARLAEERGLIFPRHVLGQVVAAIDAGKHVMLTGAPGTGKTSLAFLVGELARNSLRSTGYLAATASIDWGVGETIGRYADTPEGPMFYEGFILQTIESGSWMVIDELNRADFDKAFGPLFTVFANQPVTLPFKRVGHSFYLSLVPTGVEPPPRTEPITIPARWRIVATMNEFDKATLYRLSYGLMRRFAFVEVTSPDNDVVGELMGGAAAMADDLLLLRRFVDLGPAVFIDAGQYARRRMADGDASRSRVLYETFYAFFLPQLDRLDASHRRDLVEAMAPRFDPPERDELRRVMLAVLGAPEASVSREPTLTLEN